MANREGGYHEVCFGVSNRGTVIPSTELQKAIEYAQVNGKECFRSYFTLHKNSVQYSKEKKSLSGYQGPFTLRSIILDLDKGKDEDTILQNKAKSLFLELTEDYELDESDVRTYYSGSGFHFEIPDIFNFGENNIHLVKQTLTSCFPGIDDIYYATSIVRMPYTINKKTNRYKIRVSAQSLLQGSINDIIEASKVMPVPIIDPEWGSEANIPDWSKKIVRVPITHSVKLPELKSFKQAEASSMVTCIQTMYNQGPQVGSRHNTIMRMVSSFRRQGVPKSAIISMMQSWEPKMDKIEMLKYVSDVFDKGYKWGCNDPLMAQHCSAQCRFFHKKNYSIDTMDTGDMMKSYKKYIKTLNSGKILNLKDLYKIKNDFKMLPGEFICVIGDTGIGKTAWVQNIAIEFGIKTLYISLEVHEALLFRRFVQIANGLSKEEVDSAFVNISEPILNSMMKKIENIKVVTSPPTMSAIEKLIIEEEPQLVVIDTLDGLDVDGKTITDMTREIANELKRIANATGCIIIGIHHISKSGAIDEKGLRKHLNVHSSMGSAAIEQKADKVIGIEADGGNNSPLRHISSLKARDESPFVKIPFHFEWNTFRYQHMTPQLVIGGQL